MIATYWPARALVAVLAAARLQQLPASPPEAAAESPHVRSTDAGLLRQLRDGRVRSATFGALVDQLSRTNTIVYVEHGICGFGHYRACLPHSIVIAGGSRFIRITVDPGEQGVHELAVIAHELQHALEIARAPNIRTADDITALFRRIGRTPHCPRGTPECYETSAALAAGDAVFNELSAASKIRRE
jgi:hypothetical protein